MITGFMPKASNRDGVSGRAGHISSRLVAKGDRKFLALHGNLGHTCLYTIREIPADRELLGVGNNFPRYRSIRGSAAR